MGARKREALEQFNRDNIVAAAKELFDTKGVDRTTMDDIASLADYSKSTIYVYFRSKEDIYNSIVRDYKDILISEMEICIAESRDFETAYYRLCDLLVAFQEKYPKYYASLMGEINMTNSRKRIETQSVGQELNCLIEQLLLKGINNKDIRDDIDIKPTVMYVWSAIGGIIQVAERKKSEIEGKLRMNKEEYLRYSFRTFYESLVRR